jgi:hypothetical protein
MTDESPAFEQTYRRYLEQVASIDLASRTEVLGIGLEGGEAVIPLFGAEHRVSARGVRSPSGDQPIHSISVVLCQYLLLCPDPAPSAGADWVTYKDFSDAGPFVDGFVNNSEKALCRSFAGRLDDLREACRRLGGSDPSLEVSTELAMRFEALPRIPVVLLFNDRDEEFPADSTILFERRAEKFLDMECIAIIGWMLADHLVENAGGPGRTIM